MSQGKIIEYIDHGKVVCAVCLQDKGNRLHLLTPLNRQVNLPPKRALLVSTSSIDPLSPREELLSRLKQTDSLRDRLKKEIRVKEVWELIKDEKESYDYRYLAQLCFGETVTDDHISALVRALFDDKLYFKMKDGRFLLNSEKRVEQVIRQREEEALREERLKRGSAWIEEAFRNSLDRIPPDEEGVTDILVELALHGKEAPNFKYGKELLSRVGISDIRQARDLLIRLGIWEEDEAIELLRLDISGSFTEEQLKESDQLANIDINITGLEDLRDLDSFTIDGPLTRDFDDALSMEIQGDYIQIGIHIADVASLIAPDSIIDKEASLRGSSLYLPRRQIPMVPVNLSQDILSLRQGCDRPAISLLARFDKNGTLFDYRFVPSLINVRRQLTYDQVNEEYMQEEPFAQLYRIIDQMHKKRIEQDALILSLPDVSFKIDDDSSVSLEMISQESPSRMIVAELMILYNWLAARFCRDNNIPILYRSQKGPSERLSIDEAGYIYYFFRQRRKLKPLVIDAKPEPHTGLGLDVYTNLSSPIRRYLDLVVQRQIRSFLLNRSPVYNNEELEKIRISVMPVLRDISTVKRNRTRYWIQKYFLQHLGEDFQAIVLDVMKSTYRIILTDFFLLAEMKRGNGQDFPPGKSIMVRVKKVDPWNDLLNLEYAGRPAG